MNINTILKFLINTNNFKNKPTKIKSICLCSTIVNMHYWAWMKRPRAVEEILKPKGTRVNETGSLALYIGGLVLRHWEMGFL